MPGFASAEVARKQALHAPRTVPVRTLEDAEHNFRSHQATVATAGAREVIHYPNDRVEPATEVRQR